MSRERARRISLCLSRGCFPEALPAARSGDARLSPWRSRSTTPPGTGATARAKFATEELIPWEVEAELHEGRLPPEVEKRHKKLAIELGFSAMDVPAARGGREARIVDQVAVWEQLGRVTNALCWCFSEAQSWMFEACTRGAARAFHPAAHERQAQGVLRDHRERLGLGRRDRDDRAARPRRLPHLRREVVRHERESRGLLHPAGAAHRRRRTRARTRSSSST